MENSKITKIFQKKYYKSVFDLGEEYVSLLILKALKKNGFLSITENKELSLKELMRSLGVKKKFEYQFQWLLKFLGNNGCIKITKNDGECLYKFIVDFEENKLRKVHEKILKTDKGMAVSCEFMDYVSNYYLKFLTGEISGFEILFIKDRMRLWNEYFSNKNSGYVVYNQLNTLGLLKWAIQENKNINILELGSGTSNATKDFISSIKELEIFQNYVISDISPLFSRAGRKNLSEFINEGLRLRADKLDFNKEFNKQGFNDNEFDIVFGVNSLHTAYDVFFTLKESYNLIKPGGHLILTECIRENEDSILIQEFIFNLLDNYINVKIDTNCRVNPGFLTLNEWINALTKSGFIEIEYLLNTNGETNNGKFPIHAMVIKGKKPFNG